MFFFHVVWGFPPNVGNMTNPVPWWLGSVMDLALASVILALVQAEEAWLGPAHWALPCLLNFYCHHENRSRIACLSQGKDEGQVDQWWAESLESWLDQSRTTKTHVSDPVHRLHTYIGNSPVTPDEGMINAYCMPPRLWLLCNHSWLRPEMLTL